MTKSDIILDLISNVTDQINHSVDGNEVKLLEDVLEDLDNLLGKYTK